jgi:hypothetical protein
LRGGNTHGTIALTAERMVTDTFPPMKVETAFGQAGERATLKVVLRP